MFSAEHSNKKAASCVECVEFTSQGAVFMRRGHRGKWGAVAIIAGFFIILSLVLPTSFWWFVLAGTLILLGLWFMRYS